MRPTLTTIALCLSLLSLTACSGIPREQAGRFEQAHASYKAVKTGALRAEIEAMLGLATEQADGSLVWEERFDEGNYIRLQVWVDAEGKATRCETTKAKHWGKGNFKTSSVITTKN